MFDESIRKYFFLHILNPFEPDSNLNKIIYQNIKDSNIIIINKLLNINQTQDDSYLIISFKQTLLIIDIKHISYLNHLFSFKHELIIFFISNSKELFDQYNTIPYKEADSNPFFDEEISNFNQFFILNKAKEPSINRIWPTIQFSISSFLIQEAYYKSKQKNRFNKKFLQVSYVINNSHDYEIMEEGEDYISLRLIGIGSCFKVDLIYDIKREELLAVKTPNVIDNKIQELIKREVNNYQSINLPFFPKFYGTVKNDKYPIFEYINGQSLSDISELHLNFDDKITIIFEIMIMLYYLHDKGFIYRDLKPNNIIIDCDKNAVLIDFDRMIKITELNNNETRTADFSSIYVAPEANYGNISYKNDIYSLGQIIYFIINENDPINNDVIWLNEEIQHIYIECTNKTNPEKRPTISEVIYKLFGYFNANIKILNDNIDELYSLKNTLNLYILLANLGIAEKQFELYGIYAYDQSEFYDINKANKYLKLAADQDYIEAQFYLGNLYFEGKNIDFDINKAIHYFTLAADRNYIEAQFKLGMIYSDGKYVMRDMNKAINYLTFSANQNFIEAQFNLGIIYLEGKYITRDISKGIHYMTLAADRNFKEAQFNLGIIYFNGKYVASDINKAIKYFTLAANQNYVDAQLMLGRIYEKNQNINKAIYYYTLAANLNNSNAQFNLGVIYYEGTFGNSDINKGIHYLTLAADQNNIDAQYYLGFVYEVDDIYRDVSKAIHYYKLAANQNDYRALFNIGLIYHEGKYVYRDINKAIKYYTLSANQNYIKAQFNLGLIYYEGILVNLDIQKAIKYFTLASNQNHLNAQYFLGEIFYEGRFVDRDIYKAIHYYSLAANQNDFLSQFYLGKIFYEGSFINRDINKAIHYFSLSANQNYSVAQRYLGVIYYDNKYIARDIKKAINYFTLSAKQNDMNSQNFLGSIYYNGLYVVKDVKKAIYYFTLSANQNFAQSQFNLGLIYYEGQDIEQDIKKAMHYFKLAADQNILEAEVNLAGFYYDGKYIERDIAKAIHYYTLAANKNDPFAQINLGKIFLQYKNIDKSIHYFLLAAKQNHPEAQYILGVIYYEGIYVDQNVQKGEYYIILSSQNGFKYAAFAHGYLLHKKRDIKQAIHYYNEASSFNIQQAKNNLGIIYKKGFCNEIKANESIAIMYFEEAIRQKNDYLSMYNLAHIYFYNETLKSDIENAIDLLIKSSDHFWHSLVLLVLVLIKKNGFNIEAIKNDVNKREESTSRLIAQIESIYINNLQYDKNFHSTYESYREKDFVYNIALKPVLSSDLIESKQNENSKLKNISKEFYEGFGKDLL